MIGPENVRHTLNQSDAKLKTIAIWSLRFPRFEQLACFYVEFLLANDNLNLLIGRRDYVDFGFTKSALYVIHNLLSHEWKLIEENL